MEVPWSRSTARGQSMHIPDDNESDPYSAARLHAFTTNRHDGSSPRPPTMIERKFNNNAPSMLSRQPSTPGGYGSGGYGATSFNIGDVVSAPPSAVPSSANPFLSGEEANQMAIYGNMAPSTPLTRQPSNPYGEPMTPQSALTRQPSNPYGDPSVQQTVLTRQPSQAQVLSRQPSMQYPGSMNGSGTPITPLPPMPYASVPYTPNSAIDSTMSTGEGEEFGAYDRSSVTPFQAQQYAEIKKKLGVAANGGNTQSLGAVSEMTLTDEDYKGEDEKKVDELEEFDAEVAASRALHVVNTTPEPPLSPALKSNAQLPGSPLAATHAEKEMDMEADAQEIEFPVTPSLISSSRIMSTPPVLPEVGRPFSPMSYDFPIPVTAASSSMPIGGKGSPRGSDFGSEVHGQQGHAFSVAKAGVARSPLAEIAGMAGVEHGDEKEKGAVTPTQMPQEDAKGRELQGQGQQKRPDTVYTVYDEEDAYGGF